MDNWVQTSLASVRNLSWEDFDHRGHWVDEMAAEGPEERSPSRGSHGDPDSSLVINDISFD